MSSKLAHQAVEREIRAHNQNQAIKVVDDLEIYTNIKGWAQWVRAGDGRSLGYATSFWHKQVTMGYRRSKLQYPITDDEAIMLDNLIAQMGRENAMWTNVLVGLYIENFPIRELAKLLLVEKSKIGQLRDMALTYLYSQLKALKRRG